MKCRKQPLFLLGKATQIEDLWEVHLDASLWNTLKSIARSRNVTFSTVARFCVFALVERKNLQMNHRMQGLCERNRINQRNAQDIHRHLVCLYGEDVVMLRLAALKLRITVSALIRLALALYLPKLAMEKQSAWYVDSEQLFLLGTKRWLRVEHTELHTHGLPVINQFTFSMFLPWQWWS